MRSSKQKDVSTNLPVDAMGNTIVDPTENVTKLVEASERRQDDLRMASDKFNQNQILWMEKMMNKQSQCDKELAVLNEKLALAETNRIDAIRAVDVGAVAITSERTAASAAVLATQVTASAEALRNLVASTAATTAEQQRQQSDQFNERISKVERSQYEGQGKGSVTDPQMLVLIESVNKLLLAGGTNKGIGIGANALWLVIVALVSVTGIIVSIITTLN